MKLEISPSILSADLAQLGREIELCEVGGADAIHVDVMDGRFVPAITFGPIIVKACQRVTKLPLDVHLMIVEPEKHLEAFAEAGAALLTVHVEACAHIHGTLQAIKRLGIKAGVTFNPGTPLDALWNVVDLVDLVLIMSVNPGAGGQKFIAHSIDKVREVKRILAEVGSEAVIQIDGGINTETAKAAVGAGATNLVAGSAIFGSPAGIVGAIGALRYAAN
ncbi:MAG TPA: ribulose-phosphate 3-epimerase [Anaerolineaceae bacterium]|nr:ribulose-phosphate 3-epimerase [Anaerolineaceae bacterium]